MTHEDLIDLTQHAVMHEDTYINTHVGGLTLHVDLLCGYEPMLHGLIGPVGV